MSVRSRKNSIQIDFYYRAVRCRETLKLEPTKANLRYAYNLLATIKYAIETNTFEYRKYFPNSRSRSAIIFGNPFAGNTTVEDMLRTYFNSKKQTWTKSTRETNRDIIENHLIPAFCNVRLIDLNVGIIRKWLGTLTCSPKRMNNMLIPLRGMMKDAHADCLIDQNPMERIHNRPVRSREPIPFTPDEQKKILAILPDQVRNFIQFAFHTGLRTGELIGLQWSDIDWKRGFVCVRRSVVRKEETTTKTAAGDRDVMLFEPAIAALEDQKQFTSGTKRIFHNPKTGKPWTGPEQIRRRIWVPALKSLGIQYRELYQTRHTYASAMLTAGEPPVWIARQMGHTDPSIMFKKYARWIPEMYPHAGEKIRAFWSHNGH